MYPMYGYFLVKVIRICFYKGKFRRKQITEAIYKMKLQNEWGTFIDLKILPVSYLFYDVLSDILLSKEIINLTGG